ncbi:anticodon-binding protein [Massariosphaeria phaeospora]|uniref:Anticodon-binding protein n=1 Tax=Massariosphaeria phaeospora TaxID=100035 RepID=A0A7C8I2Q5_9PLEO|nr:anticodon-binding protein [Massariosphaeria phaeospora]
MAKSSNVPAGIKPRNKLRRQAAWLSIKKAKESSQRDERHRRKRNEASDPSLREARLSQNIPATIDSKRTWDDTAAAGDEEEWLGLAVDVERLAKRRKLEQEAAEPSDEDGVLAQLKKRDEEENVEDDEDDDADSMLESESEGEDGGSESGSETPSKPKRKPDAATRAPSPPMSTATNLELSPEFLKQKFPSLFETPKEPKILITTSLNSTLHTEAEILTSLFPNSTYIRRSSHAHGHKYSVREIAKFASNREYTTLVILMEDMHQKAPGGLDIVHLPSGPMFHFGVSNWIEGKKLPGHGNSTGHIPELILNQFRTPLGMLTAKLFQSLYPPQPQHEGRTVVTLHNQRDYIFVRRHRYVFRDKRATEKSIVDTAGKRVKGVEDIRVGLQEIGPRFTLKLRRIDRGIQWKSGQEWTWKGKMEKQRTRFAM